MYDFSSPKSVKNSIIFNTLTFFIGFLTASSCLVNEYLENCKNEVFIVLLKQSE